MSWFNTFFNSSIGKKFFMGLTGISLILFLKFHLVNNLSLFGGPEVFNTVVKNLESIKPIVRVIEVILALIFLIHIFNGLRLWLENKKARPQKYAVNGSSKNSTVYSRTMVQTGTIVFIFLIVHLRTFWMSFNNIGVNGITDHKYYEFVAASFTDPIYSGFYVIAMILLGFHLNHGFQSLFQTFGWTHKKYTPIINIIGTVYSVVVATAFAIIPIYFLMKGGN
ncbi:MAG: succinate dehydrogenase cytochrome b subunit [Ignavibacteriaceae bacterium]|nr:succinate dehydrogenase cytochrome b subunit [Ignavibacteriaceae bacterium]